MNLRKAKLAVVPDERILGAHILPTPLYRFTSLCREVISSMVSCNIRRSRSLAAICCLETFSARWDWMAVC